MTRRRQLVLLLVVFVLVPALAGFVSLLSRRNGQPTPTVVAQGVSIPAPRPPVGARPLAIVIAGNRGTEITDSLPVIEMLAASDAFEVRIVAPERIASPFFNAGLDLVPDLSFADYDALVGRPPALIVVPYLPRWQHEDASVVAFIRSHTASTTSVLSICAGAEIVAAAGLFDEHRATANDANLEPLASKHRAVQWQRDVRWVRDRKRFSSGTLAAGIDATLATIEALAGQHAAHRAIAAMRYPHGRFLADPRAVSVPRSIGTLLEASFRWEQTHVGIVISEGVSESAVAAMMEAYAATISATTTALAVRREVVRTRHGFAFVPRTTLDEARDLDATITLEPDDTQYAYDRALLQVERTHGGPTARNVGDLMNYPHAHLELAGGFPFGFTMALRALALGIIAVLLVLAARKALEHARHPR